MGKKRPTPPNPPEPPAPLAAVLTSQFKRDVEKAKRSRKDMAKLAAIMTAIIERRPLDASRRDHVLHGEWPGCRDCHVEGDWVLIYEAMDSKVIFHRTGTHSELFGR